MKELIKITEQNGNQVVSAKELSENGYKINPFASLNQQNTPVFDDTGKMVDLLIPADRLELNLLKSDIKPKDKKTYSTYIVKDLASDYIKIGRSVNVEKRLEALRVANPNLKLLKVVYSDIEKELHHLFSKKRIKGEWFSLSEDDFIIINNKYKNYASSDFK